MPPRPTRIIPTPDREFSALASVGTLRTAASQSGRPNGSDAMPGRADSEPKLLFPDLANFYAAVADLWYPLIRITAGGCLLYHGWGKLMSGATPVAAGMARNGLPVPSAWAYAAIFLE